MSIFPTWPFWFPPFTPEMPLPLLSAELRCLHTGLACSAFNRGPKPLRLTYPHLANEAVMTTMSLSSL